MTPKKKKTKRVVSGLALLAVSSSPAAARAESPCAVSVTVCVPQGAAPPSGPVVVLTPPAASAAPAAPTPTPTPPTTTPPSETPLLALDAVAQVSGFAMAIIGAAVPNKLLVRDDVALRPFVTRTSAGVGVARPF